MKTGTVMVFIAPEGRIIAHAASFDQGAPGGFTTAEAQALRCRRQLDAAVFEAFCSAALVECTDEFARERIVTAMMSKGYKRHTITVEVPT